IFIDGCFWHGCPKCKTNPKTNAKYWKTKIANNQKRDKEVKKQLVREGWKVLRFWEHEIKRNPNRIIKKIFFNLFCKQVLT
ncbi:MAG: V.TspMI, partial [Candidatus Collierbacteria bacterium GW2011_GWC2_45_40]